VAVLKADGVSTPVPESLPLVRNRVFEARSGLDLLVQEDRLRLLATWDQVLAKGSARCLAHLVEQPETTVALYGLDLREAHGVVLVLYAPTDEVDASTAKVPRAPKPPPRFSTIEKDERSFIVKTADALVAEADAAMYQSKRQGEGQPEAAWGLAGASALRSPVELVRGASADRSLRSSSGQARSLRSA
jgi:hypothetical protein